MTSKPTTSEDYGRDSLERVYATCLYVATKLGDMLNDFMIVGGFAPSLLVDQEELPWGLDAHAGTMDLDMGLALAVLKDERYREFSTRLRDAGFAPDVNKDHNPTLQRWRTDFDPPTTVDFLIPPSEVTDRGGALRHIESDLAALITPGLHIAFSDRRKVKLSGRTPSREKATRNVWVCGPGALTVLKALAFRNRGENKDAYDLTYIWSGLGVEDVASCLEPLLTDSCVQQALEIIREDFTEHDGLGPRRAAEFVTGGADDEIQADIVGLAKRLCAAFDSLKAGA